jgi:hypothetical protein
MKKQKPDADKIILHQNTAEIDSLKHDLDELLPLAEQLVTAYHKLPFANESESFYSICTNTGVNARIYLLRIVPDKVEVKGAEFEGAEFDREQAIKLGLIKCPGLIQFNSVLENFKAQGGEKYIPYFRHANRTAEIDPLTWGAFESRHTTSVSSEFEREVYNKIQNFIITNESFHEYMKKHFGIIVMGRGFINIQQFTKPSKDGKKLEINPVTFAALIKKAQSKQTE